MLPFQVGPADLHKEEHQRHKSHGCQKRQIPLVFLRIKRQSQRNHHNADQKNPDHIPFVFQLFSPLTSAFLLFRILSQFRASFQLA